MFDRVVAIARSPVARRLAALAGVLSVLIAASAAPPARADSGDVGFAGASFAGTTTPTGTKRSENLLWFNDGSWWADMWSATARQYRIFRLDLATQKWIDTGVPIDSRADTHADVLWDGAHLYVASHVFVNDEQAAVSGFPSRLYRFSYDTATRRYTLDPGFPAQINNFKTETLSIDRDSTGTLWATWQQGSRIYVNHATADDRTWGTPYPLPSASAVTVDDTSEAIAFGGRIGVMWSDQTAGDDGMHFSMHQDGAPDTAWSAAQAALAGSGTGDDHMNLKWLDAAGGRVFAAVKTSFTSSAQPLIELLVLDVASGTWRAYPIARVSDCPNRPIVLIDRQNGVLHTFATYPAPPALTCSSSGGAIYEKTSPLDAISFPPGRGTLAILDADSAFVHNVSSTRQNVDGSTGIVVLAANLSTKIYWHAYESLPSSVPTPPSASFTLSPSSGPAPLQVSFTDTSTGGPVSWLWDFGDGAASTAQNPVHTYAAAGSYTVTMTARNTAGQSSATKTVTVTAPPTGPPSAAFDAAPTTGSAPLAVTFSDRSTGAPTSWSWDFGDVASSAAQNPSHTYAAAGTYTARLTATNAGGQSSASTTITVTAAPTGTGIVREATSTTVNSTATTNITIPTPAGTTAGDVLVSCIALNGGSITGVPAGWSTIAAVTTIANPHVFGYYKITGSSEPASSTWSLASPVTAGGGIARYSGATGLDVPGTRASGAASTSAVVPGVTTTTAGAMLVGCAGANSSSTSTTIASPAGMTQAWDIGARRHELADGLQAAAGPSGAKTWTFNVAREWAGWVTALRAR